MNLNWITQPFAMYATVAAGAAAALHLFTSSKAEQRRQQIQHEHSLRALSESLAEVQSRLAAVEADCAQEARFAEALVAPLPSGFNRAKRSEALRMCSRRADVQSIASALGLSRAEVVLLAKLHPHLTDASDVQASGIFHERSRRLAYSREA